MSSEREKKVTYIQCQTCGEIYKISYAVRIDELYVQTHCPNCGLATGLNLGDKEEDKYLYYDCTKDPRYY